MSDNNNAAPYPTFEVEFESSWVKGTVVSRNTDSDISIKKIDDGGFGTTNVSYLGIRNTQRQAG